MLWVSDYPVLSTFPQRQCINLNIFKCFSDKTIIAHILCLMCQHVGCLEYCQLLTNQSLWEFQLINDPLLSWLVGMSGNISWLMIDVGRPIALFGNATSKKLVLGCVRKQVDQASESKSVSSVLPWSLLHFLPSVPWWCTLTWKSNKPSSPLVAFHQCF